MHNRESYDNAQIKTNEHTHPHLRAFASIYITKGTRLFENFSFSPFCKNGSPRKIPQALCPTTKLILEELLKARALRSREGKN